MLQNIGSSSKEKTKKKILQVSIENDKSSGKKKQYHTLLSN